jgi:hypothetical protein
VVGDYGWTHEVSSGTHGTVAAAERPGIRRKESDSAGGIAGPAARAAAAYRTTTSEITAAGLYTGLTVETTLDPATLPFLHDHQVENRPATAGCGVESIADVKFVKQDGDGAEPQVTVGGSETAAAVNAQDVSKRHFHGPACRVERT